MTYIVHIVNNLYDYSCELCGVRSSDNFHSFRSSDWNINVWHLKNQFLAEYLDINIVYLCDLSEDVYVRCDSKLSAEDAIALATVVNS